MSSLVSSPFEAVPFSARTNALFLDFDGTLAPIQEDPAAVELPPQGADLLLALSAILKGAVVLISGRDIRDLSARTPVGLWRAGGHGLEICKPGEAPTAQPDQIAPDLSAKAKAFIDPFDGVWIEEKGPVLAIHFRQNPDAEVELLDGFRALAADTLGYKAQHGKMVIELKPEHANKGIALSRLMQQPEFKGRMPIMIGDDTTDEDAMRVAKKLNGFGIKVGEGQTCADFKFNDPDMVWDWLRRIVNEHA